MPGPARMLLAAGFAQELNGRYAFQADVVHQVRPEHPDVAEHQLLREASMDRAVVRIKRAIGRLARLCCLCCLCVLSSATLRAQGSAGQIEGTVRDEQAGVLPGATLTLRNQDTGITRTLTTEGDGRFIFSALAPGRYTMRVELSGFSVQEVADITITIGLNLRQEITLKVQALAETVTIRGDSPVVDTTKAEISGTVTQEQIETLPMNSRQYLVPGTTVDATRSFFATVNVGGSMTFNGTGNIVDGTINNWAEDGEPRQDLPEDAVEEFKVTNAGYKAEFGLATGGVVEVVTKSGSNAVRGTAFEYFRNKALNSRGVFETAKPDYRRDQFGGSAGGPILRDKVHFFGSFERTDTEEFYTVRTGQPQFYSTLEGTFPLPSTRNLYSARVDWQMNNAQSAFARFLGEDDKKTCQGCGGVNASGRDEEVPRQSVVLGHTWLRGARQLNDVRFQYAHAAFYGYPGGTDIWKETGAFPTERVNRSTRTYGFPSLTYGNNYDYISPESRWELRDTYALNLGTHGVKFGGEYNDMPYVSEGAGNSPTSGTYTFSRDQFFDPDDPASIAALSGASTFSASTPYTTSHPTKYSVGFVQDDWRVRPGTTRNSGSRDLDLSAVNVYRLANGLAPISESDIDSSRISLVDMRASKALRFGERRKIDLLVQAFNVFDTTNLQAQFGGGRVGNALSNTFGKITSARPSRQVELAIRAAW
jgi:hypothetical protein